MIVICKFLRFKDKQNILKDAKKLKNSGIYIYEDFCNNTMELRKSLWEEVMEHRRQGRFAFLSYRSIILQNSQEKHLCQSLFFNKVAGLQLY